MPIGGIKFGQKTIWDEIAADIKATELEMDKEFDRIKEELEGDEEPDEVDMFVESLLNYKDVLEGKVRDLEQENEKLHAEIERQDELIEKRDVEARTQQKILNTLRSRCSEKTVDYFDNQMWGMIEICRVGEKKECDCGNFKKQIEELQAEVRDLTAENVTLGREKANLLGMRAKNGAKLQKIENEYRELKEKYETADMEREHLAKENEKLKERIKILNDRHQQDCIDLNKKQTTINELVDSYSELRRMKGLSAF